METTCIKHPLRDIIYTIDCDSFPLPHEVRSLNNYREAHDEVWQMKLLFEKERGNVLLAVIQIDLLEKERDEQQRIFDFYRSDDQTAQHAPLANMDYKLQVEMRDFYQEVKDIHQATLLFYDEIRIRTKAYDHIIDTYYRSKKGIDPLNFTVLDSIFENHTDMQVDIVSLDKDLQDFLRVLNEVYETLDDYIVQYSELYRRYSYAIKNTATLSKETQDWNDLWLGDKNIKAD